MMEYAFDAVFVVVVACALITVIWGANMFVRVFAIIIISALCINGWNRTSAYYDASKKVLGGVPVSVNDLPATYIYETGGDPQELWVIMAKPKGNNEYIVVFGDKREIMKLRQGNIFMAQDGKILALPRPE